MSICIGIRANIDGFGDDRTDVLNLGPSGVAKETSRCNEMRSTYRVVGTESGSEKVDGCTDSGSEQVRGYNDGGSEEVGGYADGRSEKVEG